MKHFTAGGRFAALLLAGLLVLPVPALAENIVWNGSGASGNTTNLKPDVYNSTEESIYPDSSNIANNTVSVGGDKPHTVYRIYGGAALVQRGSITGDYSNNTVTVSGKVTVNNIYGGYVNSFGWDPNHNNKPTTDYSTKANSENNNITIGDNVKLLGNVYGGYLTNTYGSTTGSASGNTITVSDNVDVGNNIYGGYITSVYGDVSGSATNNTINLSGNITLAPTSSIYGGYMHSDEGSTSGDAFTGNTLNLKTAGLTIKNLDNFQYHNFYVPGTLSAGGTMLTVTDTANIDNATIRVGIEGGGSQLAVGDSITLIDASGGTLNASNLVNGNSEGMVGISKKLTFDLDTNTADMLKATLLTIEDAGIAAHIRAQLKSLTEARVSGVGMLTQGADLLATQGLPQLRLNAAHTSGPAMFGVMGGQSLRYNSGSHVDVNGFNLATGLGWNFPLGTEGKNGNLLVGAFFESGWGSYDSHNSFNGGRVKGDGDTNYYGGGILARYDSAPIGPGNIYTEASFRAGKVETDYSSSDFLNSSFTGKVDYDSSAAYYGAHAGIGYLWNITENSTLDTYTKYLWTRQGSDSVTIEGDSIRFKEMDSHRWRTGAKFSHALATDSGMLFTPYLGAAYEHEFDSKARATVNGSAISAPDVKGGTGIGELGFSFKPSAASGFSVDLGMQGYTGKREGVGGSFQLKFEF